MGLMHEALEACNHAMRGTYFDDLVHLKYELEQQLRVPISQPGAVQVYFSQHFDSPNADWFILTLISKWQALYAKT